MCPEVLDPDSDSTSDADSKKYMSAFGDDIWGDWVFSGPCRVFNCPLKAQGEKPPKGLGAVRIAAQVP